jgi:hypothetical protein
LGLQVGGRLVIETHPEQAKYLANQKQGTVNKYDFTVFGRLFQGSYSSEKLCIFSVLPLDSTIEPHPRFPSAGSHTECWWRCSWSTSIEKMLNRLVCRCVEKNVMANEIAGFGDLNIFISLDFLSKLL